MNYRKQLTSVKEVFTICLAGNATITLRSRRTDRHFTYKIIKRKWSYLVKVLVGPDNTKNYMVLGEIARQKDKSIMFISSTRSRITPKALSFITFKWFWIQLNKQTIHEELEIWREGYCARCGRELTVPESISSGFGPVCVQKALGGYINEYFNLGKR